MEEILTPSSSLTSSSLVSRSFMWMFVGLLVTTLASFFTLSTPALLYAIFTNSILYWGLLLAELGMVIYFSVRISRLSFETALAIFLAYSLLNGVTISIIMLAYTEASVITTFGVAAATFGFMGFYGYTSQKDLTTIGNLCIMALLGIIVASIVNFFLHSTVFELIISYIGILIFMGLTARDTQKLKKFSLAAGTDTASLNKYAIMGALTLYLDFINLFLFILSLMGRSGENKISKGWRG
jgi:FtsH-binding integral membrane protein